MTKTEFAEGIRFMRLAFNLDDVKKEVLSTWYSLGMKDIEQGEWKSIQKRIATTEERFPSNLVRTVISYRDPRTDAMKIERPPDVSEDEERENKERLRKIVAGVFK